MPRTAIKTKSAEDTVTSNIVAHPAAALVSKLQTVEQELSSYLIERDEVVRLAMIALVAKTHIFLLGAPGTSKSLLMDMLTERIEAAPGQKLNKFFAQLSRFTGPDDLFGQISVEGLKRDDYVRVTDFMLPEAHIATLDEIWKANTAILNALLLLFNERKFRNGRHMVDVPLISALCSSNEMPQSEELAAMFDRILLRAKVEYVSDANVVRLLTLDAPPQPSVTLSLAELETAQEMARNMPIPASVVDSMATLKKDLEREGITASDRRWMQLRNVMRANALIEGRQAVDDDDLTVLRNSLWNQPDEIRKVAQICGMRANPINARTTSLLDQAISAYQTYHDQARGKQIAAQINLAMEAQGKLKEASSELENLKLQAASEGRGTGTVENAIAKIKAMRAELAEVLA